MNVYRYDAASRGARKRVVKQGAIHGKALSRRLGVDRALSTERQARLSTTLHLFEARSDCCRSSGQAQCAAGTSTLYRYILTISSAPHGGGGRRGRCHMYENITRRHDRYNPRPNAVEVKRKRYRYCGWRG